MDFRKSDNIFDNSIVDYSLNYVIFVIYASSVRPGRFMRRNFASTTPNEVKKAKFDEIPRFFGYFEHIFESIFDAFDAQKFQKISASRISRPRPHRTRVETNRVLGLLNYQPKK